MSNFNEQIKKEAGLVFLTAKEKEAGRNTIRRFMRTRPIGADAVSNGVYGKRAFSWYFVNTLSISWLRPTFAALLIILLVGAGTAFASEGAAPGDILYPIKVSVIEPLWVASAVSAESKARIETRIVERRLEEVVSLTITSPTLETAVEFEKKLERDIEKVKARIEKLSEDDKNEEAFEIASRFEAVLSHHNDSLSRLADELEEEFGDGHSNLRLVTEKLRSEAEAANKTRAETKNIIASSTAGKRFVKRAEEEFKEASSLIREVEKAIAESELIKEDTNEKFLEDARARIGEAKRELENFSSSSAEGEFVGAFNASIRAKSLAKEANRLKEFSSRLKAVKHSQSNDFFDEDELETEIEIENETEDDFDDSNFSGEDKGKNGSNSHNKERENEKSGRKDSPDKQDRQ